MRTAQSIDPLLGPPRTTPPLRLRFGRVFLRVAAISYFVIQASLLLVLLRSLRRIGVAWRIVGLTLHWSIVGGILSVLVGLAAAIIGTLIVRLMLRPSMARWYDPRPTDASIGGHAPFRLASSEWVEAELPARRLIGRRSEPGHLVLTNHRIWFFPSAWDAEPWDAPMVVLDHVRIVPSRFSALRAIQGWPDEAILRVDDGEEARIAVADPSVLLDWFEVSDVPRYLHLDH